MLEAIEIDRNSHVEVVRVIAVIASLWVIATLETEAVAVYAVSVDGHDVFVDPTTRTN